MRPTRPIPPARRRRTTWCAPGTTRYGLPTLATNCSNNYGPYHFPEKLIPLTIIRALRGQSLPVYGKGENVRDWLHVEDHAEALTLVLRQGRPGETYNVGGDSERKNIDVVRTICRLLDEMVPQSPHRPHERLIEFVTDRPGHDARYAIDAAKISSELGWRPRHELRGRAAPDGALVPRPQGLVGAGHERRLSRGALGLGLEGSLGCGRRFRLLKVLDGFNGECLAAIPHLSLSCLRVIRELEAVIAIRGKPAMIVSDNGTGLHTFGGRVGHRMALHCARQSNDASSRASVAGCATNASTTITSSPCSPRHAGSSRHGARLQHDKAARPLGQVASGGVRR